MLCLPFSRWTLSACALTAFSLFLCGPAATARAATTYYVDFEGGDDAAAGTSPEQAFRRAPGDPQAEGELALPIQREVQRMLDVGRDFSPQQIRAIRRACYAAITHIDHQLRVVIGTLREEGILDDTILCFTTDHGDMLGNHRLWAKHWMYEDSARVPMLLSGTAAQQVEGPVGHHRVDERLVGLRDVMPTLLELAGIEPPGHCEGLSMVGGEKHDHLFSGFGEQSMSERACATRMVRDPRYKLIYYPEGNVSQLFDMEEDREEMNDLSADPDHGGTLERLQGLMVEHLRTESERRWVGEDGQLVGDPAAVPLRPLPAPHYSGQRGDHWPGPD